MTLKWQIPQLSTYYNIVNLNPEKSHVKISKAQNLPNNIVIGSKVS